MTTSDIDPRISENVAAYLSARGWTNEARGPVGTLWEAQAAEYSGTRIGVPASLARNTADFRSVVERLAHVERRGVDQVQQSILLWGVDVTYLRAANDYVIADSIPLTAGVVMLESARIMYRSCATTARGPRTEIGGNYSKPGDEVIEDVRMGHTQHGSYVVPVYVRVGEAETQSQQELPGTNWRTKYVETVERRVTRTFAESMRAVVEQVVTPDRLPRAGDIPGLVGAGASREFVQAMSRLLSEPAVAEFEARFEWAETQQVASNLPKSLSAPAEAASALKATAKLMKRVRVPAFETLTGPIIEVRKEPNWEVVHATIQTMRGGRHCELRVWIKGTPLTEVLAWMDAVETILVTGRVERSNSVLTIRAPESCGPLREGYLEGSPQ
ncbi:hypothetical protein AWH04_08995 [Rhodococcus erythropolis]|jgi:hypothetical protein|nr:hypothetical protein AWH04_08995 [Rhodococcus erythropolis]